MEELTKQQIVLLTLLVSFVTSIATGIVTVALMDQAPPGVTQTVNRVVERTIEKIVPAPNQAAAVITKETVVVKEDDLVIKSVEQNSQSIVAIFSLPSGGDEKNLKFVANGLIVSKDGMIATDSAILTPVIDDNQSLVPQSFRAVLDDGTAIPILPNSNTSPYAGVALFRPDLQSIDGKTKMPVFVPAKIADDASLKLGQTVIALGGEKVSVATGIVSNLSDKTMSDTATSTVSSETKPQIIKTDIHAGVKISGTVIVTLSGDVVGMKTVSAGNADNLFLSSSAITKAISKSTASNTLKSS